MLDIYIFYLIFTVTLEGRWLSPISPMRELRLQKFRKFACGIEVSFHMGVAKVSLGWLMYCD